MSAFLVFTTGQRDVQLVQDGRRYELAATCSSRLHAELEQRQEDWEIVDTPRVKAVTPLDHLPKSRFQICTPKLDGVLAYVRDKQIQISNALILDTQRKGVAGDPWYSGAVIAKRLDDLCQTSIHTLLRDDERLVGIQDRDTVLWSSVAGRIFTFVHDALRDTVYDQILVAATGGPANMTALVEEVVRLHAAASNVRIELLEVTDGSKMEPPAPDRAVQRTAITDPIESFRARRHALELIGRGDLIAAWGAVRHVKIGAHERQWTTIVEWLYRFAASLPIPNKCDVSLLKHPKMGVTAALRVELALRSRDIPRAVHGTVAFFESALWDHLIANSFARERRMLRLKQPPDAKLIRRSQNDRTKPFEPKIVKGSTWYLVFDDGACAISLAQHYLQDNDLLKLAIAVSEVRALRNDVVHNQPTPKLMSEARNRMEQHHLWSNYRFLTQPMVQDVLRGLGEHDGQRLCDRLIADVSSRLLLP
jgi:hypothetical protein